MSTFFEDALLYMTRATSFLSLNARYNTARDCTVDIEEKALAFSLKNHIARMFFETTHALVRPLCQHTPLVTPEACRCHLFCLCRQRGCA